MKLNGPSFIFRKLSDNPPPSQVLLLSISLSQLEKPVKNESILLSEYYSNCFFFLRKVFKDVGSDVLEVFNNSLRTDVVPACFKHVVVQPFVKKPNLDSSVAAVASDLGRIKRQIGIGFTACLLDWYRTCKDSRTVVL